MGGWERWKCNKRPALFGCFIEQWSLAFFFVLSLDKEVAENGENLISAAHSKSLNKYGGMLPVD